jgi:hypothetical protein
MSFSRPDGFGQFAAAGGSNGAPLPWWAGAPHQMLYGEPPAMSPEEPCQESSFQAVPGSQALLEPLVPPSPKAVRREREFPDVTKLSMAQGEGVSVLVDRG